MKPLPAFLAEMPASPTATRGPAFTVGLLLPHEKIPRRQPVSSTNFSPHKENNVLGCHSAIRVDGSRFIKQKQNTERIQ